MKKVEINILNSEEVKNITVETIKVNVNTASHYNNLNDLIDLLTAERDAIKKAVIAKYGNMTYKDSMVSISCFDRMDFSKDDFISDHGQDEYNKYKTKKVHVERLVKFG